MTLNRFSNVELLEFPDCLGLSKKGKCFWLKLTSCQGKNCTFKRSMEESRVLLNRTYARLASLDNSTQTHIANKYYHGEKPWKEEEISKSGIEKCNR